MADGDLKTGAAEKLAPAAARAWPPASAVAAHRAGAPWSEIVAALASAELDAAGPQARYLDVGSGAGLLGDLAAQRRVARRAGHAVAIEPDAAYGVGAHFQEAHRRRLEGAPLEPGRVHVAAVLHVVEEIKRPDPFWIALRAALRPDGVALVAVWSADAPAARLARAARLRTRPTVGRAALDAATERFSTRAHWSPARIGDHAAFGAPGLLLDRFAVATGAPGPRLLLRLTR